MEDGKVKGKFIPQPEEIKRVMKKESKI